MKFKALRISQEPRAGEPADAGRAAIVARIETLTLDDLSPGNVVIRGEWSSINYKDALAATGAGRILRRYPLVGGVDVAGTVLSSEDERYRPGDAVVVTGCGLSETHDGGFSQVVRVPGDWVCRLPDGLDTRSAMAIGTAGFTAALAIHRMEQNGQVPELGPVAVSGATGGVGSLAIDMLAGLGYRVTALTSKTSADDYLRALGATDIVNLKTLDRGNRPLEKAIWGGAVDSLGGNTLAWLTRTTVPWGNIASIGLAEGAELHTTVMPFILRAVSVLGINSADVPRGLRHDLWRRLAGDLRPSSLDRITTGEVALDAVLERLPAWIDGTVTGRCVVDLR